MRLRDAGAGLRETFSKPRYVIVGLLSAAAMMIVAVWIAIANLFWFIISSPLPVAEKISGLVSLLPATYMVFSISLIALTMTVSLLFGANIALTVFYVARRYSLGRSTGLSAVGALIALLSLGCASCGSVLLFSVIGSGAGAVVLARLPLHGFEFGIIGCAVMLLSVAFAAAHVPTAEACALPPRKKIGP